MVKLTNSDSSQVTIPSNITIPSGQTSAQFSVTAIDDELFEPPVLVWILAQSTSPGLGSGVTQLTVLDNDSQWHNYAMPFDVDHDNTISPLDVITIINYLNSNQNPNLIEVTAPTPRIYIDVDEDQFVSPLDVIILINYLNKNSNSEGEGILQDLLTESIDSAIDGADDWAFLGSEEIEIWKRRQIFATSIVSST
jgi:hypothetical protein